MSDIRKWATSTSTGTSTTSSHRDGPNRHGGNIPSTSHGTGSTTSSRTNANVTVQSSSTNPTNSKKFNHFVDKDRPYAYQRTGAHTGESDFIDRLEREEAAKRKAVNNMSAREKLAMVIGNYSSSSSSSSSNFSRAGDYGSRFEKEDGYVNYHSKRANEESEEYRRFQSELLRTKPPEKYARMLNHGAAIELDSVDDVYTGQASSSMVGGPTSIKRPNVNDFYTSDAADAVGSSKSKSRSDSNTTNAIDNAFRRFDAMQQAPAITSREDRVAMISAELSEISADGLFASVLGASTAQALLENSTSSDQKPLATTVPLRFATEENYIQVFEPLLLAEAMESVHAFFTANANTPVVSTDLFKPAKSFKLKGDHRCNELPCFSVQVASMQPRNRKALSSLLTEIHIKEPDEVTDRDQTSTAPHRHHNSNSTSSSSSGRELHICHTDDLVLIVFTKQQKQEGTTLRTILLSKQPRSALGVVVTGSASSAAAFRNKAIVVLSSSLPPDISVVVGKNILCIPIMGLMTFVREWSAVQSVKNAGLVPLAGYLFKAAPVALYSQLSCLHESLKQKIKSVESLVQSASRSSAGSLSSNNQQVVSYLSRDILSDLRKLDALVFDTSTIHKAGIVPTLVKIGKRQWVAAMLPDDAHSEEIALAAKSLKTKWKDEMGSIYSKPTMESLKGGNTIGPTTALAATTVATTSVATTSECPSTIAPGLWHSLVAHYNAGQLFAIQHVSQQLVGDFQDTKIVLLQGPPGTGKTHTIMGVLSVLLADSPSDIARREARIQEQPLAKHTAWGVDSTGDASRCQASDEDTYKTKKRVLICCPSNTAIDEIIVRLIRVGLFDDQGRRRSGKSVAKVVRLGDPLEGAPPEAVETSIDYLTDLHLKRDGVYRDYLATIQAIEGIKKQIKDLETGAPPQLPNNSKAPQSTSVDQLRDCRTQLGNLRYLKTGLEGQVEKLRATIRHDLIAGAEIVASTLSGAGRQQFLDQVAHGEIRFDTAIVDEAAQATEPSTLIPLRYGCRRLVLVGDPRQLPATVLSPNAEKAGLGMSLFERLERAEHEVIMLTHQYRMHPEIRVFPSDHFYGGRLIDAQPIVDEVALLSPSTRQVTLPDSFRALGMHPVNLFDLSPDYSKEEAVGTSFRNPMEAQFIIQLLREFDGKANSDVLSVAIIAPYRSQVMHIKDLLGSHGLLRGVEVNTVDGFQGREKDIVIFSCVKTKGSIKFLSDHRRINVAITRAKRCLIVVGSVKVIQEDSMWRAFVASVRSRKRLQRVLYDAGRSGGSGETKFTIAME